MLTPVLELIPLTLEGLSICANQVEFLLDEFEEVIQPRSGHALGRGCYGCGCWHECAVLVDSGHCG